MTTIGKSNFVLNINKALGAHMLGHGMGLVLGGREQGAGAYAGAGGRAMATPARQSSKRTCI